LYDVPLLVPKIPAKPVTPTPPAFPPDYYKVYLLNLQQLKLHLRHHLRTITNWTCFSRGSSRISLRMDLQEEYFLIHLLGTCFIIPPPPPDPPGLPTTPEGLHILQHLHQ
jgi:hypothetical protein